METSVFVISDLHLGGREGFEMCSDSGRARLAQFVEYVGKQAARDRDVQLVINGDLVDFLAEQNEKGNYDGFTADQDAAISKLEHVLERSEKFWHALSDLTTSGVSLTLLLGNHDVELSLPRVRERLRRELGRGSVEFVYDNQAFTMGELLIEHGNRYDPWNVVPHDTLRRIRSQLSRGEKPPTYPTQPGSRLVVDVMNGIKDRYPWVDLLKPETGGLLKLLRVLGAVATTDVIKSIRQAERMAERWLQYDLDGMPTDEEFVNALAQSRGHASFADELVAAGPQGKDELDDLAAAVRVELRVPELLAAFRKRAEADATTFHVDIESETYLRPARKLAKKHPVVIFGHTHLPKCKEIGERRLYLNTGTWADLIRVPESAYTGTEERAKADLARFAEALRTNDIGKLRRQVPTFARVDLDTKWSVLKAGVFFFDGPDQKPVPLSTQEMSKRLEPEV